MTNPKQMIVVEGDTDKEFIECLCKSLGISAEIKHFPPKALTKLQLATPDNNGTPFNSKEGVYNILRSLIKRLEDGDLENLAIIVDADQTVGTSRGFVETVKQIEKRLKPYERIDSQHGLIFKHPQGGYPIGVWIMPNNQDDGALESWISACINNTELPLFNHATTIVNELSTTFNRTFTGNKKAKAEVATWLAWQRSPSIGLYAAVPLLNTQSPHYRNLITWLNYVFPP